MESQEIITYKPKLFKLIRSKEATAVFSDKNVLQLMEFLRVPLTIEDLEIAFKKANNEKSVKTIYRYLNKLGKAGLIVPAGKRISADEEGQIRTQTIYSRVAKVINVKLPDEETKDEELRAAGILFKERFGFEKDIPLKCAEEVIDKISWRKWEFLEEVLEKSTSKELFALINSLPLPAMARFVDTISWLLILGEKIDLEKEIEKCLTKRKK